MQLSACDDWQSGRLLSLPAMASEYFQFQELSAGWAVGWAIVQRQSFLGSHLIVLSRHHLCREQVFPQCAQVRGDQQRRMNSFQMAAADGCAVSVSKGRESALI
jgi:hypothetical protein